MTFEEMGLCPELLSAISEIGFEQPTPIQEKTIPHLLNSENDFIGLAQTGTGKTAAFGLPLLQSIDVKERNIQALILCPTRELCLQISRDLGSFAKNIRGIKNIPVYGGADIRRQISEIRSGGQIVVGTPGRVNDLIRRKVLDFSNIRKLILDEADEMLTMGFKDELDTILAETPDEKQTFLFSATMPREIETISKKHLHNPEKVEIGERNAGAENVDHQYYIVRARDKYATLKRIADNYPDCYAVVFCRTRMETKEVAEKFVKDGYNADALHGDLSQSQRDNVMDRFRSRNIQMLVATDVAARGLDVSDLTHVINYSLPDDPEVYIHRSGRTGRAGKKGISVTIINMRERGKIKQLERVTRKRFQQMKVPNGTEICGKQMMHMIDKIVNVEVNEASIQPYWDAIKEKFSGLDSDDILKRFISIEFNQLLSYYKNAPDLNSTEREGNYDRDSRGRDSRSRRGSRDGRDNRGRSRSREGGRDGSSFGNSRRKEGIDLTRLYINVGKKQNLSVQSLIGLVNDNLKSRSVEIGKIDIQRKFSFFEVDSRFGDKLTQALNNSQLNGIPLKVEPVENEPRESRGGYKSDSRSRDRSRDTRSRDSKYRGYSKNNSRKSFENKRTR